MDRLFFDIETSPNVVFTWNIGYDLQIDYNSIIQERAIICICWKWHGKDKVYSLKWDKGNDKEMVKKFFKIITKADEVIGHNGDRFDIKWFKTRAIYHGIKDMPQFKSIDTLKIARGQFKFNSNKLDYIAKYLGLGEKIKTEYNLWKDIVQKNSTKSMSKMVRYCAEDVRLLEKVYEKLEGYSKVKTHMGVVLSDKPGIKAKESKYDCPRCASKDTVRYKNRISAAGNITTQRHCNNCGKYYETPFEK